MPDDAFEHYLEIHNAYGDSVVLGDATSMGNGVANDDKVFTSRISGVIQLDIQKLNIASFIGIEDFALLKVLNCSANPLSASLDISANTALTRLICNSNKLTSLDVSQNVALTHLESRYNSFTSLNVSTNTALKTLQLEENKLTSLDVSQNAALKVLMCSNNLLSSLNISFNDSLTNLICDKNQLTSLDVSQNTVLGTLY